MSIWRSLAIAVLMSCSGAAAPRSAPSAPQAPPEAAEAAALLAAHDHPTRPAPRTPAPRTRWDRRTPPERLDLIRRRFELAPDELAQLGRAGVVVPARLTKPGYAYAYHEIFQSQLPVYITADSVFHAIFASHDAILEKLEHDALAPTLAEALDLMHCTLAYATDYPADTLRDLDLYLAVARSLASGDAGRVTGTLRVLRAIIDDELANRPLTAAEQRWLGMVTELSIDTSEDITGYPPVYSGWYFDLFLEAEANGMRRDPDPADRGRRDRVCVPPQAQGGRGVRRGRCVSRLGGGRLVR